MREVASIGLTVGDLEREARFFTQVLPFTEISRGENKGSAADTLFGQPEVDAKTVELGLGAERITLTQSALKGRPIPPDSQSDDLWFQHIAIVVSDMDKAYDFLRRQKVKHVSTAPQTLPAWNKAAGGIRAFYFRDPENHVLEIIWFPPGKGDPKWQQHNEKLFLGIDHTAIVVSDTEASLAFYRGLLGMRVAGESENYGVEQEHLNQLFGARLRITALRVAKGPGIEFLEYITPPGGRSLSEDANSSDLVFWRTCLVADQFDGLISRLDKAHGKLVSSAAVRCGGQGIKLGRSLIVRDPDGHALQLIELGGRSAGTPP